MSTLINIFSLVGSLALFLYGMKIMSEGLEKFAGDRLRSILGAMTKNRLMGVLTGVGITALIQSSSATTVMVVSFVNAGLMTLRQSIGVIMGANIGTTVTAWIISAVGFKVNISAFAIPLLAIGLPLIFSGKSKRKSIGEFVFGFSFLFMGLTFLQDAATAMNIGDMVAGMLAHVPCDSFLTIILFVIVGALVTMLVQASAATMAITLMLFGMNIPGFGFEQAAALAMGQNIGTTITAFIASLTANTQARRAALAHMFFNVFGVVVVLLVFYPACDLISWMVTDVMGGADNPLYKLSAFHTAFNIANTLLLIWFVPQIEQFVCKVLPEKDAEEPEKLQYITAGLLSTAELSIIQARKEISQFAIRCQRQFNFLLDMHNIEKDEDFEKLFDKVKKYENITDNMEYEIAHYLQHIAEGRLSDEAKLQMMRMLREIDDLESIGDCNFNIARTLSRKRSNCKEHFTDKQLANIKKMEGLVGEAMQLMVNALGQAEGEGHDIAKSYENENSINNLRNDLRADNLEQLSEGAYDYKLGAFYLDTINGFEKLADYILNVAQTKARQTRV
jgi:phosphate:Na+ symporter